MAYAKNTRIVIDSLPMNEQGEPINDLKLSGVPGKVEFIGEDGVKQVIDGIKTVTQVESKVITIKSANIGRQINICPGAKLSLSIDDAPNGQQCPITMCLGEIVLAKGKVYELEYCNDPIVGWTIADRSDPKQPNLRVTCYPEGIRNQKELIELILSHESFYNCPFVRHTIIYPAEIQHKMDMDALLSREAALLERKKAVEEQFKKQEAALDKAKKTLEKKGLV